MRVHAKISQLIPPAHVVYSQAGQHLKCMPLILTEEGHSIFLIFSLAHVNLVHKKSSNTWTSEFTHMYFNLNELLQRENNLEALVSPFTHEEINGILMNLPSGISLGPDGFNTNFMKKCWGFFLRISMTCVWDSIMEPFVLKVSMDLISH
jgi:hypothetical protein